MEPSGREFQVFYLKMFVFNLCDIIIYTTVHKSCNFHSYKLTASLGFKSGNELDYFSATDLGLPSGDLGLAGGKGHFLSTHVHMFTIICMCINFMFFVGVCDFFFIKEATYCVQENIRPFRPLCQRAILRLGEFQ